MTITRSTVLLAAGIGVVAGMRSMVAPAILSHRLAGQRRRRRVEGATRLLRSRTATALLPIFAAGEVVADKSPLVPARTDLPALAGRTASGALCGAAIAGWKGESQVLGGVIGALGAIGGTFAAHRARVSTSAALPVPDFVVAVVEDVAAVAGGWKIASELS